MKDRMAGEALLLIGGFGAAPNHRDDLRDRLEPLEADALAQIEQRAGRALNLYEADTGHDAAYPGVAAEIVEPAAGFGAAAAALRAAASLVVWAYDQFSETTGRMPMVSLGAAQYLALDDLCTRIYATPRVVTSGDMNPDNPNRSFTGADAFFVLLAAEADLHHYQISAHGELLYIGDSPPKRDDGQTPPSGDLRVGVRPDIDPFGEQTAAGDDVGHAPRPDPTMALYGDPTENDPPLSGHPLRGSLPEQPHTALRPEPSTFDEHRWAAALPPGVEPVPLTAAPAVAETAEPVPQRPSPTLPAAPPAAPPPAGAPPPPAAPPPAGAPPPPAAPPPAGAPPPPAAPPPAGAPPPPAAPPPAGAPPPPAAPPPAGAPPPPAAPPPAGAPPPPAAPPPAGAPPPPAAPPPAGAPPPPAAPPPAGAPPPPAAPPPAGAPPPPAAPPPAGAPPPPATLPPFRPPPPAPRTNTEPTRVVFSERPTDTLARWIIATMIVTATICVWVLMSAIVGVLTRLSIAEAMPSPGEPRSVRIWATLILALVAWTVATVGIAFGAISFYGRLRQRWAQSMSLRGW